MTNYVGVNLNFGISFDKCSHLELVGLDAGLPSLTEYPTVAEKPFRRHRRARHSQQIGGQLWQIGEKVF